LIYIMLGHKDFSLEEYKILKELDIGLAKELLNRIYK